MDCPICGNKGYILLRTEDGSKIARVCECMKHRRSIRSLRSAGMADMATRYTLDAYQTDNDGRRYIKATAQKFIDADTGWFFIAGKSGSGKTHICTAICIGLMERNSEIAFMPWRDESVSLKTGIKDHDWYAEKVGKLKRVPVLFIDDLFKGGSTEADVKLALEILNTRYNDTSLRTVISCERPLEEILRIDEALGGRIYERSRGFMVTAPAENWRLRR